MAGAVAVGCVCGVGAVGTVGICIKEVGVGGSKSRVRFAKWFGRRIYGGARLRFAKGGVRLGPVRAGNDGVEVEVEAKRGDVLPSGEWPENFSLLNFEDLSAHYEPGLFKADAQPDKALADVMSRTIYTARKDNTLEEVIHFFNDISGVPVVDKDQKCIGVLSRKDIDKATNGSKSLVSEVMSTPAITLSADKNVSAAAVLMLKNKIHRIPIVNESGQVVGIVTRTDIFTALESGDSS